MIIKFSLYKLNIQNYYKTLLILLLIKKSTNPEFHYYKKKTSHIITKKWINSASKTSLCQKQSNPTYSKFTNKKLSINKDRIK